MLTINREKVIIQPVERVRETWHVKEKLFGLIRYTTLVRSERIGAELSITTEIAPEKVYINGVEYLPSNPPTPEDGSK